MRSTRRWMLQSLVMSGMALAGSTGKKRVLAILGDAYHSAAPLDAALVGRLRKDGYQGVTIMDCNVPWNDFSSFDLIVMSREAHEYVQLLRERALHARLGPHHNG